MKQWKTISNLGLKEETSRTQKRKVRLTNRMIFITIVVQLGYLPLYLSLNLSIFFYINISLLLLFTSSLFFLMKRGNHTEAALLLSLILIIDVILLRFVTNENNSLLFLIPFSIFGFGFTDNMKIGFTIFIIAFLGYYIGEYLSTVIEPLLHVVSEKDRIGSLTNMAFILFLNVYLIYQLQLTNKESEIEIETQAEKLHAVNEEIRLINETLEQTVRARTEKIELQNIKLRKYAYSNSHEVRAPLARLMGLINLWNNENVLEEERTYLAQKISESSVELDQIIREVNTALDIDNENFS